MDDDGTITATSRSHLRHRGAEVERPSWWALTVVFHPSPEVVGRRLLLVKPTPCVLGRGDGALGYAALDDPELSRRHLEVAATADGVALKDLASRNGTWMDGRRISERIARAGELVTIGCIGLLVHRARRELVEPKTPMVVASLAMVELIEQIHDAATRDRAVLIEGETGVGKELIAREIHAASGRGGAFVALNCAAVGEGVLLSELFGHVQGAFSGALHHRRGIVAEADAGTLFLDEIGDASPALQAALLRLLEQREYRRLGEDRLHTSSARVVAATHVGLDEAIEAGRFRRDLHSRLARWHVVVPPLRERHADIVPLARRVLADLEDPRPLMPDLVEALHRHHWPANIRELAAVIEQAAAESKGEAVGVTRGVRSRLEVSIESSKGNSKSGAQSRSARQRPSREELLGSVERAHGNLRQAAKDLGISRATLYRWLEPAGVELSELRSNEDKK